MEHGVYLESSIVDLKPRIMDFLSLIVQQAREVKDYVISFKRKELADITGKDVRTTSRYLKELEERNIIQTKGKRGRAGGTVIRFNTDLIRFDTSENALINTDEPLPMEEAVEKLLPKKEPKKPKSNRNRRTKKQMVEARALQDSKQARLDELHSKLELLGGTPDWEWFLQTDEPVENYRTYLLSRVYNRYAALFTDDHNYEVDFLEEGNKVPTVDNDYDCLPAKFLQSPRWNQIDRMKKFCEENDIDPFVYLSAQFNRSVFDCARKKGKTALPFINSLVTDTSYEVYLQYCDYKKLIKSPSFMIYNQISAKFMDDYVITALKEAYHSADSASGMLDQRHHIQDFLEGVGSSHKEDALLSFYDTVSADMRGKVSFKTRDTLKKFVMTQSLILTGGAKKWPLHLILASESTQLMLASVPAKGADREERLRQQAWALGMLLFPDMPEQEQTLKGVKYLGQMKTMDETPRVLRLIQQRKGMHLSIADLRAAFTEYGKENIPVDDFSLLDTDQIIKKLGQEEEYIVDHNEITQTKTWKLESSIVEDTDMDKMISDSLG